MTKNSELSWVLKLGLGAKQCSRAGLRGVNSAETTHRLVIEAALVAGPCVGVVDAEGVAEGGDAGFVGGDEGAEELDAWVGAVFHGIGHGEHEGFAAIRVDGVVA